MRLLPPLFTARSAVPTVKPLTNKATVETELTNIEHILQADCADNIDVNVNDVVDNSANAAHINSDTAAADIQATPYPTLTGATLSKAQTQALADEINLIYSEVMDSLNATDARYIERVYAAVVYSELAGRSLLAAAGRLSSKRALLSVWLVGTSLLSFSKILNNMELGHNVMHGQYDWMQHPHLNSQTFDWDIVCPAPLWQHSHNYLHHTFTNIVERDHDVGYHLLRVTDEQAWTPSDRYNPVKTLILALGFEWAVGFHDIQISVDEYADAPDKHAILQQKSRALFAKIARQVGKDYIVLPTSAGLALGMPSALSTLTGNITANIVRNLWTWGIIFCGHLTEQAHIYTHLDDNESRGDWYLRQILGSSNITGSKLFHILTGNLSHQIEHHIFPDMPAHRYASVAPKVQAICAKYGIAYNTGNFATQFKQVLARIYHFSQPTSEELYAYEQAQVAASIDDTASSNHPQPSAQRNAKINTQKKTPKKQQRVTTPSSGLTGYIPQVVRHAWFYAWSKKA